MDRREKDETTLLREHWEQTAVFTDAWNIRCYDRLRQEQGTEFRELMKEELCWVSCRLLLSGWAAILFARRCVFTKYMGQPISQNWKHPPRKQIVCLSGRIWRWQTAQ